LKVIVAPVDSAGPVLDIDIDKRSPVPVYVQIADAIRSMIHAGKLGPDSILPPSKILCQRFGITRMTLRQAYARLERDGLLEAQRGRGTFVRRPRIERALSHMIGFSEEMLASGKTPSSKVLAFEQAPAEGAALQFLGEGRLHRIERLRLADGVPIAIEEVRIPVSLCPGLERFDLAASSLYILLEREYGLRFDRCEQMVAAAIPDRRQRLALQIRTNVALLVITRHSYTKSGRPATYGTTSYRGDLYTAAVDAERRPDFGKR
jgi:GntR family transcriptional regulator